MSEEKTTLEKVQGWIFQDDPETLKRINQKHKEIEERKRMANWIDIPENWDDYWEKKKSEISSEIQKMIDNNPDTELGPEARAMLQMYADHKVEMDVISMPIRLKASMLRDVTLGRVQFSDDPEFRHMTKLGNPDVIRVAIALGLEELEKRKLERGKSAMEAFRKSKAS